MYDFDKITNKCLEFWYFELSSLLHLKLLVPNFSLPLMTTIRFKDLMQIDIKKDKIIIVEQVRMPRNG